MASLFLCARLPHGDTIMQSGRNDHLDGIGSASEELWDNDGTENDIEELSDDSGDATAPAESLDDDDYPWDGEETVGEWQDWRCQQSVENMSGVTPLCNACKHFFGEYQPLDAQWVRSWKSQRGQIVLSPWLRFLATLQSLRSSARSGCAFCKLISASIKRDSPGFEPVETVYIKFQVTVSQEPSPDLTFTYMGSISPRSTVIRSDVKYLCLFHGICIRLSSLFYLYKLIALRQTI